jgi:D-alanyl-D-alanine carboxypeptidase
MAMFAALTMPLLVLQAAIPAADGRVLGHFPYGDVAPGELVDAPAGFGLHRCLIRREVLPDLERLLAAAASDPTAGGTLRGLSCHRSVERQGGVFRGGGQGDAAERAISVAPAGHSEHTTGYAIDFAIRPSPDCPDIEGCMAALPAARWLLANAPRFGFELSFPPGNRQQVKWEPWHWRWVGTSAGAPGAAKARFIFARARAAFPANPGLYPPLVIVPSSQPEPPVVATPPVVRKKRRR